MSIKHMHESIYLIYLTNQINLLLINDSPKQLSGIISNFQVIELLCSLASRL